MPRESPALDQKVSAHLTKRATKPCVVSSQTPGGVSEPCSMQVSPARDLSADGRNGLHLRYVHPEETRAGNQERGRRREGCQGSEEPGPGRAPVRMLGPRTSPACRDAGESRNFPARRLGGPAPDRAASPGTVRLRRTARPAEVKRDCP